MHRQIALLFTTAVLTSVVLTSKSFANGDPCACTEEGKSGGVTVFSGCEYHAGAEYGRFCYVVGGTKCWAAQPSQRFPGSAAKPCGYFDKDDPCACTEDGMSGGVQVFSGCEYHSGAKYGRFCYVIGGVACQTAKKSDRFPGSAVRPC